MTDTRSDTVSVVERTRAVAAGGAVVAAHFLGRTAVFVLGEEALVLAEPDGEPRRIAVHGGAILATAADGERIVTGGDDGKVVATDVSGESRMLATDAEASLDRSRRARAGRRGGLVGRQDGLRAGQREAAAIRSALDRRRARLPAQGLSARDRALQRRHAVVSQCRAGATPEKLEWKGSHLGATVSPDGRFLVTTMQEPMLHGWRLVDRKHMRMSGYAARVTSLGWTAGGHWLATSGATQLILWPFQAKDGPMGKQPRLLAPSEHRVEVVACHPKQDIVAAGYGDGLVLLVRIEDGAEILAKKPGDAPVTALAWSADGLLLAWGTENGEAGVIDLA